MSKSKNTKETSTAKAEFTLGADALTGGIQKTAQLLENAQEFGKDNLEACIESATIASRGLQAIGQNSASYAKQSIESSVEATKAVMGSKSIHEAIELQTGFAKTAFSAYVGHVSRFNEAMIATAKESFAPLQARIEAGTQIAQASRD